VKVEVPAPRSLRVGGELLVEDDFDQVEAMSPALEARIVQRGQVVVRAKARARATVVLTSRGAPVREVPINVKELLSARVDRARKKAYSTSRTMSVLVRVSTVTVPRGESIAFTWFASSVALA
jgi:hypothetical protein